MKFLCSQFSQQFTFLHRDVWDGEICAIQFANCVVLPKSDHNIIPFHDLLLTVLLGKNKGVYIIASFKSLQEPLKKGWLFY
jgi:hypothetical protein